MHPQAKANPDQQGSEHDGMTRNHPGRGARARAPGSATITIPYSTDKKPASQGAVRAD